MAKVRKGFVSNSSSSSFVCDLTGEVTETYEGLAEAGAIQCINQHTFFIEASPNNDAINAWLGSEDSEEYDEKYYELPAKLCPICNGLGHQTVIDRMKAELIRLGIDPKEFK